MAYTYITFGQLKTELANRLNDASKIFWSDTVSYSELGICLTEALRVWNVLTNYWRDRGVFQTVAGLPFYDLTSTAKDGLGAYLRPYTVTDQELVAEMQFHFLEPVTGNSWTGTEMFTFADLTKALERRRNEFLLKTGAVVTRVTQAIPPVPIGRVPLADSVLDIRRTAWIDKAGNYTPVSMEDEYSFNSFSVGWNKKPGTPQMASISAVPPITLQLSPVPGDVGTLEMMIVQSPAALDPTAGVLMNVPDDFAWAVKYGAMADLLGREGESSDPARAAYCESRWEMGIELARMAQSALQVEIDEVPVPLSALVELDKYRPLWESGIGLPSLRQKPDMAAMAGLNLLALSSVPDAVYGVTVDMVRNAPIPATDAANVQVGRAELDVILDYAQHVASFKQGGQEFVSSMASFKRMVEAAAVNNEILRSTSLYQDVFGDKVERENELRPRREVAAVEEKQ